MAHTSSDQKTLETAGYKDTVNLPRTDFPIRANAIIEDAKLLERWEREDLYAATANHNKNAETFVLHDGPPYANGNIHLGHAYNKILKDIIAKYERMSGKYVPVIPGWDCHGLPIEFKVAADNPGVSRQELQTKCRAYAQTWIEVQKKEFKTLGVMMDFENPYITMAPEQEADTVRAFGNAVAKGYITRKNKTVPWCPTCQTVLAAAEIEHAERKDPSLYVKFELAPADAHRIFSVDRKVFLVMWTTTPWTIPLNRALFLNPQATYDLLEINGELVVVGSALSEKICAALQVPKVVITTCAAFDLVGTRARHPFVAHLQVPILADQFVGLTDGTAVVHCAPGCGPEDYEMGIRYNLEIFSPIAPDGSYTQGIQPAELVGMKNQDALSWVMTALQNNNALLHKSSIKHSYPHCWRCRNGLIFRATKQWFCELSKHNLRERALTAIEEVSFVPASTRNHLKASVSGRLEWCLSRQRAWGTPIIAIVCCDCDKEHTDLNMIESVALKIEQGGIEIWNTLTINELVAPGFSCSSCGSKNFKKEEDILDVWFDSGVTHQTVLAKNSRLRYPADLYLEGIDQHRGWFQSSLLTSMMYGDRPPFKQVLTHGYTVDAQGRKMSKSLKNGVEPQEIITRLGTDGLRLWASSIDTEGDVVVSDAVLNNVQEVYRKIRNTCRGLLMNLYDFNYEEDNIDFDAMGLFDRQALCGLRDFDSRVRDAYAKRDITRVFHEVTDYCSVDISSRYLDIAKDRLYTAGAASPERRSAQTACWYMLDTVTRLIAPIMSFTAEQLSDHYQPNKKESIHLQNFSSHVPTFVWDDQEIREKQWGALEKMRSVVLKALELLRKKSIIKHSLEAKVTITMNMTNADAVLVKGLLSGAQLLSGSTYEKSSQKNYEGFFKEYCIVSACEIVETDESDSHEENSDYEDEEGDSVYYTDSGVGITVHVEHAGGNKCPRCWQWEVSSHKDGLCSRCQNVLQSAAN